LKHDKQLQQYYSQLALEGKIRSLIFGASIGLGTGFLIFIIGAFTQSNLLWLGIGLSIFASILAGLLLYRYHFKPTIKTVANRVDDLGFEERTITMIELEGDDRYIAKVQRENTKEILSKFTLHFLHFKLFTKPLIVLLTITVLMGSAIGIMMTRVNAAEQQDDPPIVDELTDDEIFQQMIDDLLSIINNANIPVELKNTLYGMVVDLEQRLPTYDTYLEKYTDVLQTRNEILQLIEDAILEEEEKLMNIAEELQKYENTEDLGLALATWDLDIIAASFDMMYDRVDDLLGQELYDVMNQTAIDIETALADAVGTSENMHNALQALADAYKINLEGFEAGQEQDTLDGLEEDMDESLEALLGAVQELIDLVEELLELEEEIEREVDEVDEFPMFMPYPEDESAGEQDGEPDTTSVNTVIDGETPYEDVYDSYYTDAMEWLTDEDLSEEMRQIIENYFDMLD
jgi:hypothetical protein